MIYVCKFVDCSYVNGKYLVFLEKFYINKIYKVQFCFFEVVIKYVKLVCEVLDEEMSLIRIFVVIVLN